jgi:hypothetical protein
MKAELRGAGTLTADLKYRRFPREGFVGTLRQLRRWIFRLRPKGAAPTTWANYADSTSYGEADAALKRPLVADFVRRTVIDVGCNTGDYSKGTALGPVLHSLLRSRYASDWRYTRRGG